MFIKKIVSQTVINILSKLFLFRSIHTRKRIISLIASLEGGYFWSPTIRNLYDKYYGISIGIGSYGGCFDVGKIPRGTKIGKYCSIAPVIYVFNADHPATYITTHPMIYNPALRFVDKEPIKRNNLIIGNDVWIGQNAIITSKVKVIEDGAIIGAGAVVTRDVKAYEIVAGVPARVIGKRFDDEIINEIRNSEWWNMDVSLIKKKIKLFESVDNIIHLRKLMDNH